jgi:hypothetical protein
VGVFGRAQLRCFFPIGRRLTPASDSCSAYPAFSASSRGHSASYLPEHIEQL